MAKDYYKTLGVSKGASKDEIKHAYKSLAKKYHPDLNKSPDAEGRFKEINEAFSVLGDDSKRAQYDQFGSDAFQGRADFSNFGADFDFSDIFESFFGSSFGGQRRGPRMQRGSDLRFELEITLEEAAFGITKTIELKKNDVCSECKGRGGSHPEACPDCSGQGVVIERRRTPFGIFQSQATCHACRGSGEALRDICTTCHGAGIVRVKKQLEIKVPAGIEEDNNLRLAHEGDPGQHGAPSGDLYVHILIKPHDFFKRLKNDIEVDVPISFTQAVFGDEITVPTLHGDARLIIPEGTQTGAVFILRQKGLPFLHSGRTGDQRVKVYVTIPKHLTKSQEKALRTFAEELGEKNTKPQKGFFSQLFR